MAYIDASATAYDKQKIQEYTRLKNERLKAYELLTEKLLPITRKLADMACNGDIVAIKEIIRLLIPNTNELVPTPTSPGIEERAKEVTSNRYLSVGELNDILQSDNKLLELQKALEYERRLKAIEDALDG